ncbi:MAG: M48 family metallopeptidase [Rhodobacteraceae bacterium]|nr:M48 family metallopeptidase [Paracoccaceae bacterium]
MPVLPGQPPIEITLRRLARSRRFSLRVSRADGRVTLTLPLRAREAEAMAFAATQEDWLRRAIAGLPQAALVGFGVLLPVEGQMLQVVPGPGRMVRVADARLEVPGEAAQVGRRVAVFLRTLARNRLAAASDRHAAALGQRFSRLTLRDPRSRWGSCTADRALMYSWRLAMAPPAVLDYVAAHEVAHLVEMNHSPAFWAVVAALRPDWKQQRDWLRAEGGGLQAYRFGE